MQYFRGGQRSDSVLQSLSTAPVSDTNANFYTERDTPEEYYALNVNWQESGAIFRYNTQEYGPTTEDDPYSDESIDPNGVRPSLNSAKVLSLPAEVPAGNQAPGLWVSSINTGCGFQEHPQGGDFATPYTFSDPQLLECPENKFTYLTSSLMVEVMSGSADYMLLGKCRMVCNHRSTKLGNEKCVLPRGHNGPCFIWTCPV